MSDGVRRNSLQSFWYAIFTSTMLAVNVSDGFNSLQYFFLRLSSTRRET